MRTKEAKSTATPAEASASAGATIPIIPPIIFHIIASTFVAGARQDPARAERLAMAVQRASDCGGNVERAAVDLMEAYPETAQIAREYGLSNTGNCDIQYSIAGGILIGLAIGFAFGVVVGAAVSN
jgi:hypothetical protein